mmetsp:Transcript_14894/g.37731  ORF Transcript_14894/g.37731 Transcript_14894/m.37731 type:complete len:201 (+) Transcript_14894:978-1580(+)
MPTAAATWKSFHNRRRRACVAAPPRWAPFVCERIRARARFPSPGFQSPGFLSPGLPSPGLQPRPEKSDKSDESDKFGSSESGGGRSFACCQFRRSRARAEPGGSVEAAAPLVRVRASERPVRSAGERWVCVRCTVHLEPAWREPRRCGATRGSCLGRGRVASPRLHARLTPADRERCGRRRARLVSAPNQSPRLAAAAYL